MSAKDIFKKIGLVLKKVFSSKYLLVFCLGCVWLAFLDENSVSNYLQYDLKIRELTSEINMNKKGIAECEKKMEEMKTDKASLEKYAREQYYMKRHNEDIFIVK